MLVLALLFASILADAGNPRDLEFTQPANATVAGAAAVAGFGGWLCMADRDNKRARLLGPLARPLHECPPGSAKRGKRCRQGACGRRTLLGPPRPGLRRQCVHCHRRHRGDGRHHSHHRHIHCVQYRGPRCVSPSRCQPRCQPRRQPRRCQFTSTAGVGAVDAAAQGPSMRGWGSVGVHKPDPWRNRSCENSTA